FESRKGANHLSHSGGCREMKTWKFLFSLRDLANPNPTKSGPTRVRKRVSGDGVKMLCRRNSDDDDEDDADEPEGGNAAVSPLERCGRLHGRSQRVGLPHAIDIACPDSSF